MSDAHRGHSSKRKSRDGADDIHPRKKHQRRTDSRAEARLSEDSGSDVDQGVSRPGKSSKGDSAPRTEKEYPSVNELKSRIRGVKRLLNKDLPADARIVQERALAGYEQDLADELARRERSNMIKKYHFVRFLDRKTATKQLKRLERRLKEKDLNADQKEALEQKIHVARVNFNYTIYYPLTEKYLSLYPKSQPETSAEGDQKPDSDAEPKHQDKLPEGQRPPMWAVVEKCMADGKLDDLREGKLNIGPDGQQNSTSAKKVLVQKDEKKAKAQKPTKEPKTQDKYQPPSADLENLNRRQRRKELQKARELAAQKAAEADGDDGFFEI
ncbi:Uncharacterized protein PECH_000449 [Penicillium ucsense]|uniref:rRNA-processing protein EFG1 n=1 Tax=Penicillium ucsense TaxID=2839758 RepID=A0A8J8W198_9EURO|nr:Uncharacterized protein PECM_006705 [Penicillium ucsense]KAF7733547.1 Uncharacterized protein PECH_000449 [Penicillium ucsense]